MNTLKTVLYIDDEPINLMLFDQIFKRDFNVLTAESGRQGLEKLKANPAISVVISDMKMPVMNGIEFINKAKKEFPDKNYYILSGYDITEEIAGALSSGLILKKFNKPFDLKEIISTIQKLD